MSAHLTFKERDEFKLRLNSSLKKPDSNQTARHNYVQPSLAWIKSQIYLLQLYTGGLRASLCLTHRI